MLDTLTEGIKQRMLSHEGEALLQKWERTGLLEGLDEVKRNNMARLLENQAGQLLKETTTMQAGDVEGFASVAFPIVRRVFGGLLAQDLVSVQPMSLPSGLIFFMDFVFSPDSGMGDLNDDGKVTRLGEVGDTSIYGAGIVGRELTGGVNLVDAAGQTGFYGLNNGFSSPTGSAVLGEVIASGTFGYNNFAPGGEYYDIVRGDPALVSGTSTIVLATASFQSTDGFNKQDLAAIVVSGSDGIGSLDILPGSGYHARRLNQLSGTSNSIVYLVGISRLGSATPVALSRSFNGHTGSTPSTRATVFFPIADEFVAAGDPLAIGVAGSNSNQSWGLENNPQIPEIDIKVQSVSVTAVTKKLKAKWSPELAQDLNAYHNLDAEVELTSVLSEQIALEIDQEILSNLVSDATGGTLFWSRQPGKFVNRESGDVNITSLYPDFTGTVSEWYETLLETVNDLSARIHRKTLRGGANFLVCSPEVAAILEFTSGFKANVVVDEDRGTWGAQKAGSLSRKMDIYVDPYFTRNLILVGRKGSSFLESGFVYAPYVPLQVTPTIFGTEDFVPRKGVMTRYAHKMVRPDMYGLVVVLDLVS